MKNFELTKDAEKDLREVARYTLNKWGREMLQEYRGGLKNYLRTSATATYRSVNSRIIFVSPDLFQ